MTGTDAAEGPDGVSFRCSLTSRRRHECEPFSEIIPSWVSRASVSWTGAGELGSDNRNEEASGRGVGHQLPVSCNCPWNSCQAGRVGYLGAHTWGGNQLPDIEELEPAPTVSRVPRQSLLLRL